LLEQLREIGDAADALADFDLTAIQHRHSGAIVTAIFQPAKTVEKDGNCVVVADVTDDAAHVVIWWMSKGAWQKAGLDRK
jgi:hypothetical protein